MNTLRRSLRAHRHAPLPFWRLGVLAVLIILLLVATAVRVHQIDAQSMWHDEGVSYGLALRSLPDSARAVATEVHLPAYFWALHGWIRLIGDSVFAIRSLSALFSVLGVALTYALGKRLYGDIAGIAAAAFVMLNTFHIYYAQEARMYAMMVATAAGSMWFFLDFVRRPRWRPAIAFALLNTVGIYTHYSYPFTMLAQGIMMTAWLVMLAREVIRGPVKYRRPRRALRAVWPILWHYMAANLLTLALFAPWIPNGLYQLSVQPNISPVVPLGELLRALQGWFAFGGTFEYSVGGMGVAVYFFLLFGLLTLPERAPGSRARWRMLLPVIWVLVAVAIFLRLELYLRYLRFLLPVQIGFALWMGRGVWVLWYIKTRERTAPVKYLPRFAAAFAVVGLLINMSGGLTPLYTQPEFQRDDYQGMAALIATDYRDGDAVILDAPNQAEVFLYYYDGQAPVFSLPKSKDDDQTLADTRRIIADYQRLFVLLWGAAEQDPSNIVENTLNREAFPASDVWYGDVRLLRYATPAEFDDRVEAAARFGDSITLARYALHTDHAMPGDVLQLHLEWQTAAPLGTRYKVFVQLLDADGALVAQRDSEPGGGLELTTGWLPGATVIDNHALVLPADLPPGDYTLITGLYNIDDPTQRLAVADRDYLTLGTITLTVD